MNAELTRRWKERWRYDQQFPLPPPRDEKQHHDDEVDGSPSNQIFQVIAVRFGERHGARGQEGKFGEGSVGKNAGQDEWQHAQDKQPEGDEAERAAFEAQAANSSSNENIRKNINRLAAASAQAVQPMALNEKIKCVSDAAAATAAKRERQ